MAIDVDSLDTGPVAYILVSRCLLTYTGLYSEIKRFSLLRCLT